MFLIKIIDMISVLASIHLELSMFSTLPRSALKDNYFSMSQPVSYNVSHTKPTIYICTNNQLWLTYTYIF